MPSRRKRVLITGAAGFIGSHLCDRFIKDGFRVVGMDNLITGNLANIEHLFELEAFQFFHHDITTYVHVAGPISATPMKSRLLTSPKRSLP